MADDTQEPNDQPPDFTALSNAALDVAKKGLGLGGDIDWVVNGLLKAAVASIGVVIRSITRIASDAVSAVNTLLEQDNPELGRLATNVLSTLFGTNVGAVIPGGVLNPGNLEDTAGPVGHAVLQAVFGSIDLSGSGSLEPGTERAEAYLGAVTEMVTRGFLLDVVEEIIPHWHFQFVHHLEEDLIAGLGLGRIARTALRPVVQTLMADPMQWALNLAYRPKLAGPPTAIAMWRRGLIDDSELDDVLGRQGYGADHIDGLKAEHAKHAGVGDLETLIAHEIIGHDDAVHRLAADGFDTQSATDVLHAAAFRRMDKWIERSALDQVAKYEAGLIDEGAFRNNLRLIGLPSDLFDVVHQLAVTHREQPRRLLSDADLFTALRNNIITTNEAHDYLIRRGYADDDVTTLLLTQLAIGKHVHEVADQRAKLAADRVAAKAAAEQARQQAAAMKAAAATTERARRAAQVAQQRAQAKADAEQRRQFLADAAARKQQLAAAAHAAGQITADQLAVANAQIAAHTAELLALANAQAARDAASFEEQILDLRQANREADIAQQLADVDLSLEPLAELRAAGIAARLANVDTLLAEKLADIDAVYAARAETIAADLQASQAAVDVRLLPTGDERQAAAAQRIADLDATLQRKIQDDNAHYDDEQAAINSELAAGTIPAKTAQTKTDAVATARAQAQRLAQQSHDLAVAQLTAAGTSADALGVADATNAKTKLQTAADAAMRKLSDDKIAQQLAAQQTADKERLALQAVAQQVGPITAAEAARRKLGIDEQDASAKRNEQVVSTEIAKARAAADAQIARLHATTAAAEARLQALQAAVTARESATEGHVSEAAALDAQIERQRQELERTIAAHAAAPVSGGA